VGDNIKQSKFEFLNQKVYDVEDNMKEIHDQSNKKVNIIKEQISKIQKQMEDEKEKSDTLLENKSHYIKILEQKIFERFDQESQVKLYYYVFR
jgi:hypothetical protein